MNILITAYDPAAAQVLRRLLARRPGHTVIEVKTGLEVIDALERRPIDALVIEMQLPIMGGLEALRIIRATPKFTDLPVIVLTHGADGQLVNELRTLGTAGVVLQSLSPERIVSKLEPLLVSVLAGTIRPCRAGAKRSEWRLHESSATVFADGDPEFVRHFRGVVGGHLKLIEASTGVQALDYCLSRHPDAVILGSDLGLMNRDRVAEKLRANQDFTSPIIALCAKSEVEGIRESGLFDDVLVRRYSPAELQREIVRLARPMSALDLFNQAVPDFRTHLLRAVEQTLGVMLGVDVELASEGTTAPHADGTASALITTDRHQVTVEFRFEKPSGRVLAAAFLGMQPDELGDEEIDSVFGEIVNVVTGRLRPVLDERGVSATIGLPEISHDVAAVTDTDKRATVLSFKASDRPVTFDLRLIAAAVAHAGTQANTDGVALLRTEA